MTPSERVPCPVCFGRKKLIPVVVRPAPGVSRQEVAESLVDNDGLDCPTCGCQGTITEERERRLEMGGKLRDARRSAGMGIREFAEALGVLPSVWNAIEHGRGLPAAELPDDIRVFLRGCAHRCDMLPLALRPHVERLAAKYIPQEFVATDPRAKK